MASACFQPWCALYLACRPSPSSTTSLFSVDQRGVAYYRPQQLWAPARPRHRRAVVMRFGGDGDGDDLSAGDDAPETLFMRELRKRGLSPSSDNKVPGGSSGVASLETRTKEKDEDKGKQGSSSSSMGRDAESSAKSSAPAAPPWTDQRKLSMALNSEGIDGLIPRAWELLKLGSSFFIFLWPLMLVTVAVFAAAYIYLGASFIHGGSSRSGAAAYVELEQVVGQEVVSCDPQGPLCL